MKLTRSAAAIGAAVVLAGAAAGCGSSGSSSGSSGGSSSASGVPAQLTLWRMGPSTPAQLTWLNGVFSQYRKNFPKYAKTKINVQWIPWANRTTKWQSALASGKGGPDVTELGNTDTPLEATLGALANIAPEVNAWSNKSNLVPGMLANDTKGSSIYAVPWFGGVRGIWYRKDQFAKAGIASTPTTWAQLVADAKKLMKAYPGTYGFGAPTNYTNGMASFIWGAGGQIAVQQNGKWVGQLTTPQSEAGIREWVDMYTTFKVSPAKYIGQDEQGTPPATTGGSTEDFALGKLDMYLDGPWAKGTFPKNAVDTKNFASFPIPSQNGPNPAPAFAGGSDLGVFATSKYQQADWDLIQIMDSVPNSTSFANSQGFFPPDTSQLTGGEYANNELMSGFAKAAAYTQLSPMNSKYWSAADFGGLVIIPTMLKKLMEGAPFQSTVAAANAQLTSVLNTGKES